MAGGIGGSGQDSTVARLGGRLVGREAARLRQRLRRRPRRVRLGTLRRTTPVSDDFGYDRGTPVDRYYIERFLDEHRTDIRGSVLEVKDSSYTERFGSGVAEMQVLDVDADNPLATIVADLAAADTIPPRRFDCFILTQTLQLIFDTPAALRHAHRVLKPGGVLLVTVPTVSRVVDEYGMTDYWRFTRASCTALFERVFGADAIRVTTYGNVLTSIAFLAGMAHEELTVRELETHDPRFAMLVSVRGVKR
jgi:SAM-dependent methyltransferase